MKIHIGPYPEQHLRSKLLDTYTKDYFADPVTRFEKFLDKTDICFQFILNHTVNPILARRKRKIKVHIDDYDVWGADHTMTLVIHPILVRLKEKKNGAPWTDDEDVPEHLRSSVFARENEWDTDKNHFARWDWILSEMIWAFEQELKEEECYVSDTEIEKRKQNGRRLFAKYYNGLWY